MVVLLYAGSKGEQIGKEIETTIKSMFPGKMIEKVADRAKKHGSCFNIEDRNLLTHEHNLIYKFKYALTSTAKQ